MKHSNDEKIYFCDRQKASNLIDCLKLNNIADKYDVFTIRFLDITVIIYNCKQDKS